MRILSLSPGQKPGTAFVSFAYDPELVTLIKQVPGREWSKARKLWVVPALPDTLALLRGRLPAGVTLKVAPSLEADIAAREGALASAAAVREKGDSAIAFDYLTQPYAHQRAGLEFLATLGSGALLWEMGLGKTKTAIDYAELLHHVAGDAPEDQRVRCHACGESRLAHRGGAALSGCGMFDATPLRVLVICPNTVKRNWGAEIEKHAGHTDYVIPDGSLPSRARAIASRRYTIVNCEVLSYKTTADALRAVAWDLVIVDESTRFKTPNAHRTKQLHKLDAKRRVILTGTPITGKPEDAWAQMHFVEPGMLGSFWSFTDRYLVKNPWTHAVEGLRPGMESDLASKIASRSYRIRKDEVLDLPPKVFEDRLVELTDAQATLYAEMKRDLRMTLAGKTVEAWNILTQLLRLTQITAGLVGAGDSYRWIEENAKQRALAELLDDLGPDEPVVIFGIYQKELEALAQRFSDNGFEEPMPIIYGPTHERIRAKFIEDFQSGRIKRLFVQQHTGGIGINLTAAKTAVYTTRSWSLEDWLQSQDRLHRIGQTGTVTIVTLTAKGTIDERIAQALGQKQDIADALTGDGARALARELLED